MKKALNIKQQPTGSSGNSLFRPTMAYDGSGRRISKTRWVKSANSQDWEKELVTHYTGIGTEIRENFAGPIKETKVVVNMPQGLGRYGIEDAERPDFDGMTGDGLIGYIPNAKFEWYLKNHLGSTMLVYGTQANAAGGVLENKLEPLAAYDYRAFGEQVNLVSSNNGVDKVTENFTGKELDDEIALNYFGARYLDPMLGLWTSVDPARQFASLYLYAGNGMNPVNLIDPDGTTDIVTTKLGEQNQTIISGMLHLDNDFSNVWVNLPNGTTQNFKAPPKDSYFYSKTGDKFNIVGQQFSINMENEVYQLLDDAWSQWPADGPLWNSGGDYDFKYNYYRDTEDNPKNSYSVGFLNGTIMTARDVGNAIWGGWVRNMYPIPFRSHSAMQFVSDIVAGGSEDRGSAVMQSWGFYNFKP